jgi:hypothetical protein
MNLSKLTAPLTVDEIDFRIQSINNGKYATVLAYKDARVDMQRLDDAVGVLNWKREHTRDNKNCVVSIWCDDKKQWISKEDTGTESMAEAQKGLASDSFKRACFNIGIGRELYDYPVIQIKLNDDEVSETGKQKPKYRASFNLNFKDWKWETSFKDGKLIGISCKDSKGVLRFKHGDIVTVLTDENINSSIAKGKQAGLIDLINAGKFSATKEQIERLKK